MGRPSPVAGPSFRRASATSGLRIVGLRIKLTAALSDDPGPSTSTAPLITTAEQR